MSGLIEAAKCRWICKFSRCVQAHSISHKMVAAWKSALGRFAMIFGIVVKSHGKNPLSLLFLENFKVALFQLAVLILLHNLVDFGNILIQFLYLLLLILLFCPSFNAKLDHARYLSWYRRHLILPFEIIDLYKILQVLLLRDFKLLTFQAVANRLSIFQREMRVRRLSWRIDICRSFS